MYIIIECHGTLENVGICREENGEVQTFETEEEAKMRASTIAQNPLVVEFKPKYEVLYKHMNFTTNRRK